MSEEKVEDAVIVKSQDTLKDSPEKDNDPTISKLDPKVKEQLDELFEYLNSGPRYLITVHTLNNGKLNHHILTNNFPDVDILKSIGSAEKLAVERLKNL